MRLFAPRNLALMVVTAIALYLCWLIILPFLLIIIWALVLAIVFYPVYARLIRWGRGPVTSGVFTTLLVVITVVVPLTLIGFAMVHEVSVAGPQILEGVTNLVNMLGSETPIRKWAQQYVDIDAWFEPEFISARVKSLSGAIAAETMAVVGDIFGIIMQGFFVLFTLYYLLRDADRIIATLRRFVPLEGQDTDRILRETNGVIRASLNGVLAIAAIQGALGGLAFWILRISSPLLWGVVMFFTSMIPVAGAFVVWVPAAVYLLITGHWVKALLLTLWGALVIGTIDNLLRPRFVGQKTKLHELVVLFSVLGGLKVFGVLGIVVGPVVVAITLALLDVWRQANTTRAGRVT